MTTPVKQSQYPEMVYPDIEKAVGRLLRPLVADDGHIGNFVIIEFDQVSEVIGALETPFISIRLRGGPIDSDDFTWYPNIEVSCWGRTRSVAQDAAFEATRLIMSTGGEECGGVGIDGVEDVTGPEEQMFDSRDERAMRRMFQLAIRPEYQQL